MTFCSIYVRELGIWVFTQQTVELEPLHCCEVNMMSGVLFGLSILRIYYLWRNRSFATAEDISVHGSLDSLIANGSICLDKELILPIFKCTRSIGYESSSHRISYSAHESKVCCSTSRAGPRWFRRCRPHAKNFENHDRKLNSRRRVIAPQQTSITESQVWLVR